MFKAIEGQRVPNVTFKTRRDHEWVELSTDDVFAGKTVVVFSLPGAFTPTCSLKHLPGFFELADAIRARGVDTIACMAVNDVFVMHAWGKDQGVGDAVLMLADGSADYAKALGLESDSSAWGMGINWDRSVFPSL